MDPGLACPAFSFAGCPVTAMQEVQSNQDNITLGGFTDRITDAMFSNHGEMEFLSVGGSSHRAG